MSGKAPIDGFSMGAQVSNHTFTILETGAASSLSAFRAGRPMVLDFWHTRCTNCPAALNKLDRMASSGKYPGVVFAACAISLGTDMTDQEHTLEMLDGEWESLKHLWMSFDEKEIAKAEYGFSSVPFCAVFATDGSVVSMGDPQSIDFTVLTAAKPLGESNRDLPAPVLTLDEDF
eukprot:CAMPEP_0119299210 /NCGR_PEP_ID=MMETSP1333-20130426/1322_1 /TAXON_ID=418940 /ORGANISM="Scyphosphaera apsteinii, Strain RCC1455" /LENGTH=174 /DNA_ID=CAMNT_0007300567 /DNA_START=38 /DNA_END=562 /DNA_ORIENTATION=+